MRCALRPTATSAVRRASLDGENSRYRWQGRQGSNLQNLSFWRRALYQLSYAPVFNSGLILASALPYAASRKKPLLGLPVLRMPPTPRTELLQRQSVLIIPLVLLSVIVALSTVGTRQRDEHSIRFLSHRSIASYVY